MDPTKWKSVLVPRWMYEEIVAISHIEGRTISGQLRFMYEEWKSRNLSAADMVVVKAKVVENRELERRATSAARHEDEEEMEEPVFIAGIEALSPTRRFGKSGG